LVEQLHGYANKAICILHAVLNVLRRPCRYLRRCTVAFVGNDGEAGLQ